MNLKLPRLFPLIESTKKDNQEVLAKVLPNYSAGQSFISYNFALQKEKQVLNLPANFFSSNEDFEQYFRIEANPYFQSSKQVLQEIKDISYPHVIFLGTGSMTPQNFRNVSCILLGVNESCFIMLDCGEGSYVQLVDQFGDKASNIL